MTKDPELIARIWPGYSQLPELWLRRAGEATGEPASRLDAVLESLSEPRDPGALLLELVSRGAFGAAELLADSLEASPMAGEELASALDVRVELAACRQRLERLGPRRAPKLDAEFRWLDRRGAAALASRRAVMKTIGDRLDEAERCWAGELQQRAALLPREQRDAVNESLEGNALDVAEWLLAQPLGEATARQRPLRPPRWTWDKATPDQVAAWLQDREPAPVGLRALWRSAGNEGELVAWLEDREGAGNAGRLAARVEQALHAYGDSDFAGLQPWLSAQVVPDPEGVRLVRDDVADTIPIHWTELVRALGAGEHVPVQLVRCVGQALPLERLLNDGAVPWKGKRDFEATRRWIADYFDLHRFVPQRMHVIDLLTYESGGCGALLWALVVSLIGVLRRASTGRQVGLGAVEMVRGDPAVLAATERFLQQVAHTPHERRTLAALVACSASGRDEPAATLQQVIEWVMIFDPDPHLPDVERALAALADGGVVRRRGETWELPDDGLGARLVRLIGDPMAWLDASYQTS